MRFSCGCAPLFAHALTRAFCHVYIYIFSLFPALSLSHLALPRAARFLFLFLFSVRVLFLLLRHRLLRHLRRYCDREGAGVRCLWPRGGVRCFSSTPTVTLLPPRRHRLHLPQGGASVDCTYFAPAPTAAGAGLSAPSPGPCLRRLAPGRVCRGSFLLRLDRCSASSQVSQGHAQRRA